jgi:hypothetical protein
MILAVYVCASTQLSEPVALQSSIVRSSSSEITKLYVAHEQISCKQDKMKMNFPLPVIDH